MRVVIAADHNGVPLKSRLAGWLTGRGHLVADLGAHTTDVVDYPPLCAEVGRRVAAGHDDLGIVIGGSGQGEVIACNKVRGVRAGLAYSRFAVEISRGNNDANVMVLGTKVLGDDEAEELLALWLDTPFKGGVHAARVAQIGALEQQG
ncbi:RpiB/LacA/LacB family sugar-phosphate isomerase [Nonomuraea jiangxiensis]|uniref:Ribose 5-phosphate isomerase B n=1 Tax=Nonomuraea jiangxiensis TaxID=633440 RepID=A0A1G9SQ20_9ACTN|nr:RpiB/LacA/LacB family sugar-phosphate isomerase [Nonomuraea jiangxiensis]SDM37447.1 ribose 5-phosphate isomerase B [Nonomuraea jiangxiensis]